MHFVYIDDSGDGRVACFSALIIPADQWRTSLDHLLSVRRLMRDSDGIRMSIEMHATDWNGGKGNIAPHPVFKPRRVQLFNYFLSGIAMLPSAALINACVPYAQQNRAFEWLLNRIQTNMSKAGSMALLICDQGKSYDKLKRRLGVFNYVPSRFGAWDNGERARNFQATRLVEDIVYRDSSQSVFIQAADACAYALLRRERQLESKNALGLHESFNILERILVKQAFAADPMGIIR